MTPIDGARKWLADYGWQVVDVEEGLDGRLNRDSVEIRRGMAPEVELLTLLHEMAHILLHHAEGRRPFNALDEARREVTAESAGVAAALLLGVDVSAVSAEYMATFPGVQPERSAGSTGRFIADSVKTIMR